MILVAIGFILFVLLLYRLESNQLDREALRKGHRVILYRPKVESFSWGMNIVLTEGGSKEAIWMVEDDDEEG